MMDTLLLSVLIPIALVLIFKFLNAKHLPPIYGVYQQKNKFYLFKFIFMYCVLKWRQTLARLKRSYAVEKGESGDGTIYIHNDDQVLEQIFNLADHPMGVDAVYFNGMSQKGDVVVCGLARRPKHICDTFVYLKVAGEDLLLTPKLPDTYVEQTSTEEGAYKAQGLELIKFMPMRTWTLSYKGDMKLNSNKEKTVKVEMDLTWGAQWAPFNYDWQMSTTCMASCLAKEPWSRDYFNTLKKYHQTHYEQMGFLNGKVLIDGKEHPLSMPCMRDHSCGPMRDWRTFHRYVYHFMFLENGDCMAVGSVCQPVILSNLTIGYYCRMVDQEVFAVTHSDFKLYHHGENQIMPKDYGFVFQAGSSTSYEVKVQVMDEVSFYIGKDRVSKLYERWSNVEVNGIKGWACVEWQYNNLRQQTKL